MSTLEGYVGQYACYHRDPRNIMTHYVGIPLIVFSLLCLLSRPSLVINAPMLGDLVVSPALVVWVLSSLFSLKLDVRFGVTMTLFHGLLLYFAQPIAQWSTLLWLSASIGIFVGGWVLQFIGHYFEGKKPAFVDDIMGLAIGPLFIVVELAFLLGLRKPLQQQVEGIAGPVRQQ